eukprot:952805-Pelagomonas_calceolata.AAC.2
MACFLQRQVSNEEGSFAIECVHSSASPGLMVHYEDFRQSAHTFYVRLLQVAAGMFQVDTQILALAGTGMCAHTCACAHACDLFSIAYSVYSMPAFQNMPSFMHMVHLKVA